MWLEGGTTGKRMTEFIGNTLADIGPGTMARRRCFIMDNLGCVALFVIIECFLFK
jgi:hypothetical protein